MQIVLGQARAVSQIQRAFNAGRLAHTWMFFGPAGVGKATLAVQLAKTRLCDQPQKRPNGELKTPIATLPADFPVTLPCDVCESCRAVDTGNHPDLHVITKELIRYYDRGGKSKGTTLSIQVIRNEITGSNSEDQPAEAKIYRRSFRGRGKFFIIDEAELMEIPAQNALLKTLEEPPPDSYLILVTTSPDELLSTIRSRSQMVRFNELPDEPIVHALIGQGLPQEDAKLLTRLSHGSMGRALGWAADMKRIRDKQAAAAARKEKAGKKSADDDGEPPALDPSGMLGWTRRLASTLRGFTAGQAGGSEVAALLQKLAAESAEVALMRDPLTSKDRAVRDGLAMFLGIAADILDDRQRLAIGAPAAVPFPGAGQALSPDVVRAMIAAARLAESQIDQNSHVPLTITTLAVAWEQALQGAAAIS